MAGGLTGEVLGKAVGTSGARLYLQKELPSGSGLRILMENKYVLTIFFSPVAEEAATFLVSTCLTRWRRFAGNR